MGRVEGKVVVVTGAAGGQGAAEARALVREGASVIATDLGEDDPQLGDGVVYRRLDVADPEHWRELGEWISRAHGHVDALVNNAAVPFRERQVDLADWNRLHNPFFAAEKPDYLHISERIVPALLSAGVTQVQVDEMLIANPRRFFSQGS